MTNMKNLVRDVVASPLGDVIASVGHGVADAQAALDEGSLSEVLDIYTEGDDEKKQLLREIGYRPTFYALPETTGEVRIALRLGNGAHGAGAAVPIKPGAAPSATVRALPTRIGLNAGFGKKLYAAPVDATYANSYGFQADISAKLTFTIKPVPAPDGADELRRVPDVLSRSAADARAALGALGLEAIFRDADGNAVSSPEDSALLQSQSPVSGEIARLGDAVILTLVPPGTS